MPSFRPLASGMPKGDWQIRRSHWLAPDLVFAHSGVQAYVYGEPVADAHANEIRVNGLGGTGWPAQQNGPGFAPDGTNFLYWDLPAPLEMPLTLSAWWQGTASTTADRLLSVRRPTADNGGYTIGRSSTELARLDVVANNGTQAGVNSSGYTFVASAWVHGVATLTSTTSRAIYANGGSKKTSGSSVAAATLVSRIAIANAATSTPTIATSAIEGIALPLVIARVLDDAEVARLYQEQIENPWTLFEPRRIWVPVSSGGTNTYTFSVSGGASFSGASPLIRERVQTPSGGIAFAGAPVISHERAIAASGQVTFSGTAPIVSTASYQFDVSGGVTFSGSPDVIKEKILPADGGVNFGGSARLIFVPVGGTGTNDSDRISVGVSRKVGVS